MIPTIIALFFTVAPQSVPEHGRPPCQMPGGEQACQRFNHYMPPTPKPREPRGSRR